MSNRLDDPFSDDYPKWRFVLGFGVFLVGIWLLGLVVDFASTVWRVIR